MGGDSTKIIAVAIRDRPPRRRKNDCFRTLTPWHFATFPPTKQLLLLPQFGFHISTPKVVQLLCPFGENLYSCCCCCAWVNFSESFQNQTAYMSLKVWKNDTEIGAEKEPNGPQRRPKSSKKGVPKRGRSQEGPQGAPGSMLVRAGKPFLCIFTVCQCFPMCSWSFSFET